MGVIGAAVRMDRGAYIVGVAVAEDDVLERELSLPAPRDVSEPEQLAELHIRLYDLLQEVDPSELALYVPGAMAASASSNQEQRTSGVIMAAAGRSGVAMSPWSRAQLGVAAGLGGRAKAEDAIGALCEQLTPEPSTIETRRAASAAKAAVISGGS